MYSTCGERPDAVRVAERRAGAGLVLVVERDDVLEPGLLRPEHSPNVRDRPDLGPGIATRPPGLGPTKCFRTSSRWREPTRMAMECRPCGDPADCVEHLDSRGRVRAGRPASTRGRPQDAVVTAGAGVPGAIREASRLAEPASARTMRGGECHARGRLTDTTPHAGAALLVAQSAAGSARDSAQAVPDRARNTRAGLSGVRSPRRGSRSRRPRAAGAASRRWPRPRRRRGGPRPPAPASSPRPAARASRAGRRPGRSTPP